MALVSTIIYIYCGAIVVVGDAIDYSDIIDTSKPEEFVDFTEDDFNLRYEDYLGVDMKQLVKDELTKEGQQLDAKVTSFLNNPIQGSGKFEGDIEIPTESMVDLSGDNSLSTSAYAAIKRKKKLWVDGIIPYRISSNYGFLSKLHIIAAVKEINKNTCLKMVPYTDHDDYIVIKPKIGCSSFIGRVGGVQHVSISAGCTEKATIIHEVMHAAGFYHEQARFDRDEHIIIHWNNIDPDPKIRSQFKKQNASVISTFGIPYDQYSIMHYQYDAFAVQSGLVTISAINNEPLGNAKGLTKFDIDKLNTLYDCPEKPDLSVFEKKVSNLTTKANINASTCDNSTFCDPTAVNDTDLILAAEKYQPEVTYEKAPWFAPKYNPELKRQLINHFTNHHNDDNAIQVALQIIKSFFNRPWFVVSCNHNDDVSSNGAINVKVDDRQHMFYHYNHPTWGDATEESVKLYLNSIQWTIKSAHDVGRTLINHMKGKWFSVISSTNDTIVHENDINVRLNNDVKFMTVFKKWD